MTNQKENLAVILLGIVRASNMIKKSMKLTPLF